MAFSVQYDFRVLDRFSRPVQKMNDALKTQMQTMKKLHGRAGQLGKRMQGLGSEMTNLQTAAGAAGATFVLTDLIQTASRFEFALNKVESVTGATAEGMAKLRAQAKDLGATTQFSAVQSADAMTYLGMAGLKTNEILEVMPGMLDLAAAGNLQLSDAADIATNVMSMYGMELSEIGHLSDVLAKAAASSNTNVYELSEAIKNVGATANQAGVSVEETTGALMILANSGIKGGEAGTQLMNAFKALTAMTPKTAKALKAMDIAPESLLDSEGKIKDFNGILSQLASKGATLGELFQIFDIRGAKAMAVLKDAGDKQLSSFITSLENADGTAKSMAKTLMKGAPGAIKRFQSALEGVKLVMASTILPAFTSLITKVSQVFAYLQESAPWVLKFATYGLVLFAALGAIVVPLGIIASSLGTLLTLIGAISAPVLAVVAAVTAVGAAFVYWYKSAHPVIDVIKRMANLIGGVFAPLIPDLSGFFEGGAKSAGFFSAAMDKLGSVLQVMLSPLEAMLVLVRGLVEGFVSIVTLDFDKLKGIGGKLMSGLGDAGGSFVGGIKDLFGMGDSTETTARDASQEKTRATTNNNKVNANINLRAEKGTNVSAAEPDLDTGGNVAFAN